MRRAPLLPCTLIALTAAAREQMAVKLPVGPTSLLDLTALNVEGLPPRVQVVGLDGSGKERAKHECPIRRGKLVPRVGEPEVERYRTAF